MQPLLYLVAFVAGAAASMQTGVNMRLTRHLDQPMQATLISFVVGGLATIIYCAVGRFSWSFAELAQAPWWAWTGGLLGAFFVWSMIVLTPKVGGIAVMLSLVIAGQMAASITIDHFGLLGVTVREIGAGRIAGAALILAGVLVMAYTTRAGPGPELAKLESISEK